MKTKNQRNKKIDILKGFLIFLVVWGHSIQLGFGYDYAEGYGCYDDCIFKLIYSFHMPLFMAISGYLFKYSIVNGLWTSLRKKINSIVIPYFFYCSLFALVNISSLFSNGFDLLGMYANCFWFLNSLLFNVLIVSIVVYVIRNRYLQHMMFIVISIAMMFIPQDYLYNTHAYVFPAFCLGFFVNEFGITFTVKKWMCLLATFFMLVTPLFFTKDLYVYTTGICVVSNQGIDIQQVLRDVERWIFAFVNSMGLITIMGGGFLQWKKCNFQVLGRYSIGIYCLSSILQTFFYKFNNHFLFVAIPHNYFTPAIYAIITIVICKIILQFVEKNKITKLLFLGGR